jgi:hypothetical protein
MNLSDPATKQDLNDGVEQQNRALADTRHELLTAIQQSEQRMTEHLQEFVRDSQTEILRAFAAFQNALHSYGDPGRSPQPN